ncbi:hypothetical protein [Pseudoalteromonas sp. SCSIO 43201]|nr:hypothetical protein [Pseudoalteromonas sp. SCSIO 43201]
MNKSNDKKQEVEQYKAKTERLKVYAQIITQVVKAVGLVIFI